MQHFASEVPERHSGIHTLSVSPAGGRYGHAGLGLLQPQPFFTSTIDNDVFAICQSKNKGGRE
jgi:hypothetical protein